jgi:hypothetical protein
MTTLLDKQRAAPSNDESLEVRQTLGAGNVIVLGVFTDYVQEKGLGFGEAASKVIALLERLRERDE